MFAVSYSTPEENFLILVSESMFSDPNQGIDPVNRLIDGIYSSKREPGLNIFFVGKEQKAFSLSCFTIGWCRIVWPNGTQDK